MVGATWLTDGSETLAFVSSEASLLRYAASLVRPQGLKGGGMAGINLGGDAQAVFFGAIRTDDDEHGEPLVVTSTGHDGEGDAVRGVSGEGPGDRRRAGAPVPEGRERVAAGVDRPAPGRHERVGVRRWSCPRWTCGGTGPGRRIRVRTWSVT